MTEYYYLKHNEIIKQGDEIDACNDGWNDNPKWEAVSPSCVGTLAPDPIYPSHRRYRRAVSTPASPDALQKENDELRKCIIEAYNSANGGSKVFTILENGLLIGNAKQTEAIPAPSPDAVREALDAVNKGDILISSILEDYENDKGLSIPYITEDQQKNHGKLWVIAECERQLLRFETIRAALKAQLGV